MWILLQFNYTLKALTGQPFRATRSCFYLGLSATAPFECHIELITYYFSSAVIAEIIVGAYGLAALGTKTRSN